MASGPGTCKSDKLTSGASPASQCRALAARTAAAACLRAHRRRGATEARGRWRYYARATEFTCSVRAVASVKGGAVKLTLWTSCSEQPREVNGSPVWRHVVKRDYFIARGPIRHSADLLRFVLETITGGAHQSAVRAPRGENDDSGCLHSGRLQRWALAPSFRRARWLAVRGEAARRAALDPPEILLLDGDPAPAPPTRADTLAITGGARYTRMRHCLCPAER